MIGLDQAKQTIDIMMNPEKGTQKFFGFKDSLVWYYKLAIVPLIISIIGVLIFGTAAITLFHAFGGHGLFALGGLAVVFGVVLIIALFAVIVPVGFFIDAAVLHFFGKFVFRRFKSDYEHTFSAVVYGASPSVLFWWLTFIPILGWLLQFVIGIWALIVLIFAASNQQKTSKLSVLGVIIGEVVIVIVIIFVVLLALRI